MSLFSSQIIIAAIMVIDNTLYFTEAQYRFRAWTVGFLNKLVRSVFIWSSLHESCCFFVLRREKAKCFPHFDGRGAGGKAVPGHRGQRCRRYRPRAAASSAPGAAGASMGLPGPGETPPSPAGARPARRRPRSPLAGRGQRCPAPAAPEAPARCCPALPAGPGTLGCRGAAGPRRLLCPAPKGGAGRAGPELRREERGRGRSVAGTDPRRAASR